LQLCADRTAALVGQVFVVDDLHFFIIDIKHRQTVDSPLPTKLGSWEADLMQKV